MISAHRAYSLSQTQPPLVSGRFLASDLLSVVLDVGTSELGMLEEMPSEGESDVVSRLVE